MSRIAGLWFCATLFLIAAMSVAAGPSPPISDPHKVGSMDELDRFVSRYDHPSTVDRLETAIRAKGMKVFARIDHAAAAREAGLEMPPTQVLIFGAPAAGTAPMLSWPDLALDLPLRVLVREDTQGRVWVGMHRAATLERLHGLPAGSLAPMAAANGLIRATVAADANED